MRAHTRAVGAYAPGLRPSAAEFWFLLLFLGVTLALPRVARGDQVLGSYLEEGNKSAYDTLSVVYEGSSAVSITELIFDLSGSSGAVFDPSGYAFEVTSSDAVGFDVSLGFDLQASDLLRLAFTDFEPGETFAFRVDVDDPKGKSTTGSDWEGSRLDVVFSSGIGSFGSYVRDSNNAATAVVPNPEPSAGLLFGMGMVALAWWRPRRR